MVTQTVRTYGCFNCTHEWVAPVVYGETTYSLSGEKTVWCPICSKRFSYATPQYEIEVEDIVESPKMQIVIRSDAAKVYASECGRHGGVNWNRNWYETLQKVEGMTLDVETNYLFSDQYNTVPIPGVSDNGLRIMDDVVEAVINDAREGRKFCQYCHHHNDIDAVECHYCNSIDYFKKFKPFKKRVTVLDFENALKNFVSEAQQIVNEYAVRIGIEFPSQLSVDTNGKKYYRIVSTRAGVDGRMLYDQQSVYCFINIENGDILKAKGWKAPETKNPRGNIYKPETIRAAVGAHGASYLR